MADGWISEDDSEMFKPTIEIVPRPVTYERKDRDHFNSYNDRNNSREIKSRTWLPTSKEDQNSLTLEVPSSRVGRIIGRGGATIKQLQKDSGATVKILDADGSRHARVVIYGSEHARTQARNIIEPLAGLSIRSMSPPPPEPTPQREEPKQVSFPVDEKTGLINWEAVSQRKQQERIDRLSKDYPMIKNLYKEHPDTAAMTTEEVKQWHKANNNITVNRALESDSPAPHIPNPITTFERGFSKYPELMQEIAKQGFEFPSPIQSQAWPILLSGHDMIGIAQTGTGKTLAFLLPALIHIDEQPVPRSKRKGPNVLVLAPTRELALQIEKEVNKYSYRNIKAVCVYGGGSRKHQIEKCAEGVQIVIATPGRFNDLVDSDFIDIESVTYLVLDEADRMLDMGFEPQIRRSLIGIRGDRQTVMTSATWPSGVRRLASSFMTDPLQVVVGSLDLAAVHTVTQEVVFLEDEEKFNSLVAFLKALKADEKAIVFCGRRQTAICISTDIAMMGIPYQSIYGGLEQCDRELAVKEVSDGTVNILIATDIASRGLDIENVTHVLNFDFPHNIEEYVHRVGRTGRAGKKGKAISYLTRQDWGKAGDLIKLMEEANQIVPDELVDMSKRYQSMLAKKVVTRPQRGRYSKPSRSVWE